jgi:hypothetical protein
LLLHLKAPNCDDFLESRARQLQWLVLPLVENLALLAGSVIVRATLIIELPFDYPSVDTAFLRFRGEPLLLDTSTSRLKHSAPHLSVDQDRDASDVRELRERDDDLRHIHLPQKNVFYVCDGRVEIQRCQTGSDPKREPDVRGGGAEVR